MTGWVDALDSDEVSGWALEAGTMTPDRVAIYVDDRELAQIPCNLPRPDLRNLGLGAGYGGFRYLFLEHIGDVKPQKVVVRALSSGEILPRAIGKEVERAGSTVVWAPLGDGAFSKPAYAVVPIFQLWPISADGDGLRRQEGAREHFTLSGLALAPQDAVLNVVPATDSDGVTVGPLESQDAPLAGLPEGAPNYRDIRFEITVTARRQKQYLAFNLVDLNPKSPGYGRNPLNPAACMCVPLRYDWMTTAPAGKNIERVVGPNSWRLAMGDGLTTAYQMHSLTRNFLSGPEPLTILDWGIGCGRVAVPMKRCFNPDARVIGVDVDRVNAEWCRENLPDIEASVCDFFPPLEFQTSSIDMIYGISVMTHLTEGAQYAWLKELRRILKPHGICALTTHGEYAFLRYCELLRQNGRLLDKTIVTQLSLLGISDTMIDNFLGSQLDLKNYYRATLQLQRQVEEYWSQFLKIIAYYPAGLAGRQDIVVMRKD